MNFVYFYLLEQLGLMALECGAMPRTFGESLRAAMLGAHLKPLTLAVKAKIPAPRISYLLSTSSIPRQETLDKLVAALGISHRDLLRDVMTPWGLPLCGEPVSSVAEHDKPPDKVPKYSERPPVKKRRAG